MAVPQLRGMLRRQLYRDIVTAVTLGWIAGAGWWFGVAIPRRKLYEDFYRNYDAKAVADSMKASFEEGRWASFRNTVLGVVTPVCAMYVIVCKCPKKTAW